MFCPNCGTQLNDNTKFCSKCGAKMEPPDTGDAPRVATHTPPFSQPTPPPQFQQHSQAPPPHPGGAPVLSESISSTLDPMDCIRTGWNMVMSNIGIFILGSIIIFAIQVAVSLVPIAGQIAAIFLMPLNAGLFIMAFKTMSGGTPDISDVFAGYRRFADSLLVQFISSIFVSLGIVFCVAPGVFLAVCYMLALPLVIDRGMGFWDAMTLSMAEVRNQWMAFFLLAILLLLVILAGAIALGVGLFIAIPVCVCSLAVAYSRVFTVENKLP